ncbi:MAG: hypothetical protein D6762_03505 [Candidatus Neomarinimicrobiota bacterium]|nr:MAG: hypothetical protein D6762_03505 [Candidatus Neomarinimicrobiota bacterium]
MLKVLDIGHSNYSLDTALSILETEVSQAMYSGRVKAIKIIHGHGTGALRKAVRQWCEDQQGRFRAVIPGEDYDLFHADSIAMRQECNLPYDPDFGRKNRAVTYLWLW